jgi:hypothetical protein
MGAEPISIAGTVAGGLLDQASQPSGLRPLPTSDWLEARRHSRSHFVRLRLEVPFQGRDVRRHLLSRFAPDKERDEDLPDAVAGEVDVDHES